MIIRKARIEDVKACHNLSKIRELLTATGEPVPLWYLKGVVKDKRTIFLVVEEKGKIIGYSTADIISGNGAIGWFLSVNPKYQNKGIGKKLVKELEKELRKKGVKWIIGYAPQFNKKTLAFHKKIGFTLGEKMIEILKMLK